MLHIKIMGTPPEILKKIKLRNAKIIVLWARHNRTAKEIAEKYGLTERRVQQIIYDNHDFVKVNQAKEKAKRLNILNRLIEAKKDTSKSDILDLLEAQRKEIEGDEKSSRSAGETKVIIIRPDGNAAVLKPEPKENGTENRIEAVSRSLSI